MKTKRMMTSIFIIFAFILVAPLGVASAHIVELVKSEPAVNALLDAPPTQVRAWFNEEMRTGDSTLQVVNAAGSQVDLGDGGVDLTDPDHASMLVGLPPDLPAGAYTVRWHVVLLDGDATDGEFNFFVGQAGVAAATAVAQEVAASSDQAQAGSDPGATSNILLTLGIAGLAVVIVGAGAVAVVNRQKRSNQGD